MAAMTEISVSQAVYTIDKKIDVGLTNVGYRGYGERDYYRPTKSRSECECECAGLRPRRNITEWNRGEFYGSYDEWAWADYQACINNCMNPEDYPIDRDI